MLKIENITVDGYENVIEIFDKEVGLHAFIAVHDTTLGPALGGTRIFPYQSREEALEDVLRLAMGMTHKSALVEDGLGGGKSVIIADPKVDKTEKLLFAFGKAIDSLKGKYITAEDVGSTPHDMILIHKATPYVSALPTLTSSGDPSRFTAWGVYCGMKAVSKKLWGTDSLAGKTIAIQGVGHVGARLANLLFWEGANLIITDSDKKRRKHLSFKWGAQAVKKDEIYEVECDIFSPCAMGGILNEETIPRLRCKAIAGAANNQLLTEKDGERIMERGILYAPDFIINSGGIINASAEFEPGGYHPKISREKVNKIYDTLLQVFDQAEKEKKTANQVAIELAEYKLLHGIGKRIHPIKFTEACNT